MNKKIIYPILLIASTLIMSTAFAQGRSISRAKKIKDPYKTPSGEVLNVGSMIKLLSPENRAQEYSYVTALNNFNEPIAPVSARMKGKTQPVKFFKEDDGVMYLFTNFFVVNIDAALEAEEIKIVKE